MGRLSIFNRTRNFSCEGDHCNDLKLVMCQDCGYQMETAAGVHATCPKCGGTRFNLVREFYSPENVPEKVEDPRPDFKKVFDSTKKAKQRKIFSDTTERRSIFGSDEIFQREFSMPTSNFEYSLRNYAGSTISSDTVEKIFGMTSEELAEKTYASCDEDGNVTIDKNAFLDTKLFSKLIISVTKILDLDPAVTMEPCKEKVIDMLEDRGLPKKGIMIIKKSHNLIPAGECCSDNDSWCEDSGICNDLKLEFGGGHKDIHDFNGIINSRYPDAPSNIMDILSKKGIIIVKGGNVDIMK
jgi:hypothetical protein